GGLSYRIERSRYYVTQFRDGISGLRIRRIESFQPYDVFVERRLAATFDFIDRLGKRHERLENHISSLYQYFLPHNAMAIKPKIESRNETIQENQAAAEEHRFWEGLNLTTGSIVNVAIFVIFAAFALRRYLKFRKRATPQKLA